MVAWIVGITLILIFLAAVVYAIAKPKRERRVARTEHHPEDFAQR